MTHLYQETSVRSLYTDRKFGAKETARDAPSPVITHRPMSSGPLGPNSMFRITLWCVEQYRQLIAVRARFAVSNP